MTLSEFYSECRSYKVEMVIRTVVLDHCDIESWEQGQQELPHVFNDAWIGTWVRTFEHVKKSQRKGSATSSSISVDENGVPTKFIAEIDKRRAKHLQVILHDIPFPPLHIYYFCSPLVDLSYQ